MPREALLAVLKQHPFVEEFQPQHIEKLISLAKEVEFARDQVLFHEGDDYHDFLLIVAGRVALEIEAPGHTLRVQTLSAGDELGWSAILMGRGKHFQARALERVKAIALDGPTLQAACREDKAFGYASCPSGCRPRGCSCSTCTRRWPSARGRSGRSSARRWRKPQLAGRCS
jgi:signal-transduction protein with cAMP-binding, CBS, and nucleotidyltransferase domain